MFVFFHLKTAYEVRIRCWSSDLYSSVRGVIAGQVSKCWRAGELQLLRDEFGKALGSLEVADGDVAAVLSRFKLGEPKPAVSESKTMNEEPAPKAETPKAPAKPKAREAAAEADHAPSASASQSQTLRVNINVLENLMKIGRASCRERVGQYV